MSKKEHNWKDYYSRTTTAPGPSQTQVFLTDLPIGGRILDFGTGSGRWASAFHRDRPDLTIDVLDQNINSVQLPEDLHGARIKTIFQEFTSEPVYDAVWANASLFFVEKDEQESCTQRLVAALKPGGKLCFSMVEHSQLGFHGRTEAEIKHMLQSAGLEIESIERKDHIKYGEKETVIPTFFVSARKPYSR